MYIHEPKEVQWLQQQIEPEAYAWALPKEQKLRVLESLYEGEEVRTVPTTSALSDRSASRSKAPKQAIPIPYRN
jgi:hypothetical protein